MIKKFSPRGILVLAVAWACIGLWGLALGNKGFAIGGAVLAAAFAVWWFVRLRPHRKS